MISRRRIAAVVAGLALVIGGLGSGLLLVGDGASEMAAAATDIVRVGSGYSCSSAIDAGLVRVYNPGGNAFTVNAGCQGHIDRLVIDTWTADGIRITGSKTGGLLEIGRLEITCHARDVANAVHQDGVQAFGDYVTVHGGVIDCGSANNAAVYLSSNSNNATDHVVFENMLLKRANSTLNVEDSVGPANAVRDSLVCQGWVRTIAGSRMDLTGTSTLPGSDPRCATTATKTVMEPRPPSDTQPPPLDGWTETLPTDTSPTTDTIPTTTEPPPATTEPPPPPPPDPTCDAACVAAFEATIAERDATIAALNARLSAIAGWYATYPG